MSTSTEAGSPSAPSIFRADLMQGKHAFLTGGTSGIVHAIAQRYADAGAAVSLLGRNAEKAEAAAASIRASGARAVGVTADVRDPAALQQAIDRACEAHGPIDALVCGAAGNFPAPAMQMSPNGFKAVVDIDLLGTFNACRLAFDRMRKPGASILAISATQSLAPSVLQAHVCAAKAGIDMMIRVLAMEWGPAGVRVNAIAPGPIADTEGMERLTPTPESKARLASLIPLGRYGTKQELAEIALFMASPAAALITGAVLVADGGQVLGGFGAFTNLGG